MHPMRRAWAILAVLVLLAGPVVMLAGQSCCSQPACCSETYCPLPAKHAPKKAHGEEPGCHHSSAPTDNCAVKSSCGHRTHASMVLPIPPVVLQTQISLPTPEDTLGVFVAA